MKKSVNEKRTRAGYSRGDQFYASYPAGSELLTDPTKELDLGLKALDFDFFMVDYDGSRVGELEDS